VAWYRAHRDWWETSRKDAELVYRANEDILDS
jgi:dTDP-glucose 4,6-dehydratase